MENLNLIRALAWKFHKRTGIDIEELTAEASLAYCEAITAYHPDKGCKLSSYAWLVIRNHLINVCKREDRTKKLFVQNENPEMIPDTDVPEDFVEYIKRWPKDYQEIAFIILAEPERFLGTTPNFKRQTGPSTPKRRLRQALRERGWTWAKIDKAFRYMPRLLNGKDL